MGLDLPPEVTDPSIMQFGMWDTLYNLLLFLFWFRIWFRPDERVFHFNPYAGRIALASERAVQFVRPVLLNAPAPLVAGIAVVFLIVFRAAAVPSETLWMLQVGFERAPADPADFAGCVFFSFLSFMLFLFSLWGITLVYARDDRAASFRHTTETLHVLARPITRIPRVARPAVLLLFGILLAAGARAAAHGGSLPDLAASTGVQLVISALAAWANVLPIIQQFVILLIIGSWVSAFSVSTSLLFLCRDWLDMLMGPMRRLPLRIGVLDLTAVAFLFVLIAVYFGLMAILFKLYTGLA